WSAAWSSSSPPRWRPPRPGIPRPPRTPRPPLWRPGPWRPPRPAETPPGSAGEPGAPPGPPGPRLAPSARPPARARRPRVGAAPLRGLGGQSAPGGLAQGVALQPGEPDRLTQLVRQPAQLLVKDGPQVIADLRGGGRFRLGPRTHLRLLDPPAGPPRLERGAV